MKAQQIRLIRDCPVDVRHGLKKGRVFDVVKHPAGGSPAGTWVMGDMGKRVMLWSHEYEKIES